MISGEDKEKQNKRAGSPLAGQAKDARRSHDRQSQESAPIRQTSPLPNGVSTSTNDTPGQKNHSPRHTYLQSICEVLRDAPRGLGKKEIFDAIEERHGYLFPDRSVGKVRAGLHATFSAEVRKQDPKIWQWATEDDEGRKTRRWALAGCHLTGERHSPATFAGSDSPAVRTGSSAPAESSARGTNHVRERTGGIGALPNEDDNITVSAPSGALLHDLHLWRNADLSPVANKSAKEAQDDLVGSVRPTFSGDAVPAASQGFLDVSGATNHVKDTSNMNGAGGHGLDPELLHYGKLVRRRKILKPELTYLVEQQKLRESEASALIENIAQLDAEEHKAAAELQRIRNENVQMKAKRNQIQSESQIALEQIDTSKRELQAIEEELS